MAQPLKNIAGKKKSTFAARIISDLANPLILPPLVLWIIGNTVHLSNYMILLLLVSTIVFFSLLPGAVAIVVSLHHPNRSLDFPDRETRIPFYEISMLSIGTGSIFIFGLFDNPIIRLTTLIFVVALMSGFIINLSWKISFHATALATSGCCLLFFGNMYTAGNLSLITGSVLLSILLPLVIWARYRLKIHSIPELLGGSIMGFVLTALAFVVWNLTD
ncbi:MAG TPA: hypothetical protein VJ964_03475 [Balneolaceae bacterium]|nr:hypothetical protein [Balneolaceae bacterium]